MGWSQRRSAHRAQTRHASDITRAESATKGTTPYAVNTVSKEESNGGTLPSHWAIASAMPCRRSISLTHLEHPAGQVGRDDLDPALRPQPAGALAGTTTDLQDAVCPGGHPTPRTRHWRPISRAPRPTPMTWPTSCSGTWA